MMLSMTIHYCLNLIIITSKIPEIGHQTVNEGSAYVFATLTYNRSASFAFLLLITLFKIHEDLGQANYTNIVVSVPLFYSDEEKFSIYWAVKRVFSHDESMPLIRLRCAESTMFTYLLQDQLQASINVTLASELTDSGASHGMSSRMVGGYYRIIDTVQSQDLDCRDLVRIMRSNRSPVQVTKQDILGLFMNPEDFIQMTNRELVDLLCICSCLSILMMYIGFLREPRRVCDSIILCGEHVKKMGLDTMMSHIVSLFPQYYHSDLTIKVNSEPLASRMMMSTLTEKDGFMMNDSIRRIPQITYDEMPRLEIERQTFQVGDEAKVVLPLSNNGMAVIVVLVSWGSTQRYYVILLDCPEVIDRKFSVSFEWDEMAQHIKLDIRSQDPERRWIDYRSLYGTYPIKSRVGFNLALNLSGGREYVIHSSAEKILGWMNVNSVNAYLTTLKSHIIELDNNRGSNFGLKPRDSEPQEQKGRVQTRETRSSSFTDIKTQKALHALGGAKQSKDEVIAKIVKSVRWLKDNKQVVMPQSAYLVMDFLDDMEAGE